MNLETVLLRLSHDLRDMVTDETSDQDTRALRDSSELIRVLARMIKGKPAQEVHQAFGAPGDWGYETPIGSALYTLYSPPQQHL